MSAEDQLVEASVVCERPRTSGGSERFVPTLSPSVTGWIANRVRGAVDDVVVSILVLPGRWLFRVEYGASASTLDEPACGERNALELAEAVRGWARSAGLLARVDGGHTHESRVALTPLRG